MAEEILLGCFSLRTLYDKIYILYSTYGTPEMTGSESRCTLVSGVQRECVFLVPAESLAEERGAISKNE